jgi:hypothetical protein
MNRKKDRLADAQRLVLTDAELAHLRLVIESSLRDDHSALPPAYWRRRLNDLLVHANLLKHQKEQIVELLSRLGSPETGQES